MTALAWQGQAVAGLQPDLLVRELEFHLALKHDPPVGGPTPVLLAEVLGELEQPQPSVAEDCGLLARAGPDRRPGHLLEPDGHGGGYVLHTSAMTPENVSLPGMAALDRSFDSQRCHPPS